MSLPGSSLGREYFNLDNNLLGRRWGRESNSALEMCTVTAKWPDSEKKEALSKSLREKEALLTILFLECFLVLYSEEKSL